MITKSKAAIKKVAKSGKKQVQQHVLSSDSGSEYEDHDNTEDGSEEEDELVSSNGESDVVVSHNAQ